MAAEDTQLILNAIAQAKPNNGLKLIVAMTAIVVALMAPMYVVVDQLSESFDKHEELMAHPEAAQVVSRMEQKLLELDELRKWKSEWEPRVRSLDSMQSERLSFLWAAVFGEDSHYELRPSDSLNEQ